ncbi:hypothetical protein ABBQ32_013646 [Trebouxia sp. C0010 RCD-2024]
MAAGSLRKIDHNHLHHTKGAWWLESWFHFSFANYYNPANMNFGALRVINDDYIKGPSGFGKHPHRDAEIFTYIVEGQLSHEDSMGNKEALPRGCVQYLSAGTGITHSEFNHDKETVRSLQIWMTPDRKGHTPQYGSNRYTKADRHNKLLLILGGSKEVPTWEAVSPGKGIKLHQDANVFVSECDAGTKFSLALGAKRQAYLICIEGNLAVNHEHLTTRDAAEAVAEDAEPMPLHLEALQEGSHFMIIEMAKS